MMLICNEVGKNTKKYVTIIFVTAESLKKKRLYIRKEEIKMMYVVKKMNHRNTHWEFLWKQEAGKENYTIYVMN